MELAAHNLAGPRRGFGFAWEDSWLWVTVLGSHFGVGELTTHSGLIILVGIGMFTGGTGF